MPSTDVAADWIDERVRQAAPPGGPSQRLILEVVLLLAAIFFLAYVLYEAQFSGTVRWVVGSAIIAATAFYAWYAVARRTSEPLPLAAPGGVAGLQTGELTPLVAAVRRADEGMVYSQVAVSTRAREAFARQVALARGLSAEDLRRLECDPAELRNVLQDPVLADFLYLPSWDQSERYRWVRETRDGGGFRAAFRRVLERMEAWR